MLKHSSIQHLWGIEPTFAGLSPSLGQIIYVLLSFTPTFRLDLHGLVEFG